MLTMVGLMNVLLRQRWIILGAGAFGLVVAVAWSVLKASYVSTASFTPAVQSPAIQNAASVAQAFGINLGTANAGPSLDFYVAVIRSRDLLADLVTTPYRFPGAGSGDTASASLLEIYGMESDTSDQALLPATRRLRGEIDIASDPGSNLVTVRVHAEGPELAEAVGSRLLELLGRFNIDQLQSRASAERKFVEDRMKLARSQLSAAEDSLREFLESNRSFENSPRLRFEEQRLQRNIDLRQQVYTSLAEAYEQARISEVRDTPVITVVDSPEGSAMRQRHAVRNGLVGLVLGLLLGTVIGSGREYLAREREEHPEDYSEFVRLRGRVFGKRLTR
jgi:uncharacterized protein involved in exopolysaccharide biosynthesis